VTDAAVTRNAAETERLGEKLAATLSRDDVVYLEGDLGAGKTAFARGLARGLRAAERQVASPTFAILHEYAGDDGAIVLRHLDLYRLGESPRELEVLGLPGSMEGAPVCIEWPRSAVEAALPPTIQVRIESEPGDVRRVSISRLSAGSRKR
jgi:tRNA threonylcarbamoyladenosine biosynthesis protein TsaE